MSADWSIYVFFASIFLLCRDDDGFLSGWGISHLDQKISFALSAASGRSQLYGNCPCWDVYC